MKCKACIAYGKDRTGFHGCLIKTTIRKYRDGTVGCYKKQTMIRKELNKINKR